MNPGMGRGGGFGRGRGRGWGTGAGRGFGWGRGGGWGTVPQVAAPDPDALSQKIADLQAQLSELGEQIRELKQTSPSKEEK
jgi:hypothetical protein